MTTNNLDPELPEAIEFTIPLSCSGMRLDQAVAQVLDEFSRARLQQWIKEGLLTVDGAVAQPKTKVLGGEHIELIAHVEDQALWQPEPMDLTIVYEDDSLLVIDKPAGLVVHPAAGNWQGTLLNALLYHSPQLNKVPRAGIVHRLDKDTTGLMVVAKTLQAQTHLVEQLQARTVSREYLAVVHGSFVSGGTVDLPIGRHRVDRKKMAVDEEGKEAITHYRLAEKLPNFTVLTVKLETGRTHQIRVHMSHLHHPLVGDPLYGGRMKFPKGASDALREAIKAFPRQALHAQALSLVHPASGEIMEWKSPVPQDIQALIAFLRQEDRNA